MAVVVQSSGRQGPPGAKGDKGDPGNGGLAIVDVSKPPYNAVADGTTDNTSAIQLAATDNPIAELYFPGPGTYRFSQTFDITNPIAVAIGAAISVDTTKTLTTGPADISTTQFAFTGLGTVRLVNQGTVYASWFGAGIISDLAFAINQCDAALGTDIGGIVVPGSGNFLQPMVLQNEGHHIILAAGRYSASFDNLSTQAIPWVLADYCSIVGAGPGTILEENSGTNIFGAGQCQTVIAPLGYVTDVTGGSAGGYGNIYLSDFLGSAPGGNGFAIGGAIGFVNLGNAFNCRVERVDTLENHGGGVYLGGKSLPQNLPGTISIAAGGTGNVTAVTGAGTSFKKLFPGMMLTVAESRFTITATKGSKTYVTSADVTALLNVNEQLVINPQLPDETQVLTVSTIAGGGLSFTANEAFQGDSGTYPIVRGYLYVANIIDDTHMTITAGGPLNPYYRGITLSGATLQAKFCAYNNTIRDCRFSRSYGQVVAGVNCFRVYLDGCVFTECSPTVPHATSAVDFEANTFYDYMSDIAITKCIFDGRGGFFQNDCSGIQIAGVYSTLGVNTGVDVTLYKGHIITGCIFYNMVTAIHLLGVGGVSCSSNTIDTCAQSALQVDGSTNVNISGNMLNLANTTLGMDSSTHVSLTGTSVHGGASFSEVSGGVGPNFVNCDYNVITGNVIDTAGNGAPVVVLTGPNSRFGPNMVNGALCTGPTEASIEIIDEIMTSDATVTPFPKAIYTVPNNSGADIKFTIEGRNLANNGDYYRGDGRATYEVAAGSFSTVSALAVTNEVTPAGWGHPTVPVASDTHQYQPNVTGKGRDAHPLDSENGDSDYASSPGVQSVCVFRPVPSPRD